MDCLCQDSIPEQLTLKHLVAALKHWIASSGRQRFTQRLSGSLEAASVPENTCMFCWLQGRSVSVCHKVYSVRAEKLFYSSRNTQFTFSTGTHWKWETCTVRYDSPQNRKTSSTVLDFRDSPAHTPIVGQQLINFSSLCRHSWIAFWLQEAGWTHFMLSLSLWA